MALAGYDVRSLEELFASWGYPGRNARRLLRRYYDSGGERLDETLISPVLAGRLREEVGLRETEVVARREAGDGTVKLLVGLDVKRQMSKVKSGEVAGGGAGGSAYRRLPSAYSSSVECVLMPSHRADRAAGCVSSQVGCAMGCDFCASTKAGVERSLTSGEILLKALVAALAVDTGSGAHTPLALQGRMNQ